VETEDDVVEVALLVDIIVEIEDDEDGIVLPEELVDELVEIADVLNEELVETIVLKLVELEVVDEMEDVLVKERTTLDDVVELDVDDSIELLEIEVDEGALEDDVELVVDGSTKLLEIKVDEERTLDEVIEEVELLEGMVEVPGCVLDNEVLDADDVLVDARLDEELEITGAA
jgi:hypothetical protein